MIIGYLDPWGFMNGLTALRSIQGFGVRSFLKGFRPVWVIKGFDGFV